MTDATEITKIDYSQSIEKISADQADRQFDIEQLATSLKYNGSTQIDALIDGIRDNQRIIGGQLFQMGARLKLLKEQVPHGEFINTLKKLGIDYRLSARTIQAAVKFANVSVTTHLEKMGKTKIFEMLVLDDEEVKELAENGSVLGIELDEIDRMSCSELRKRLRDAKADSEAKDELLAKNAQNLQKLQKENIKAKNTKHLKEPTPDESLKEFKTEVSARFIDTASRIESDLVPAIAQLFEYGEEQQIDVTSWMYEQVKNIEVQLSVICDKYALQPDFTLDQEVDGE